MYAVGNLPDHVTRYNHKDQSRWMTPPRASRSFTLRGVLEGLMYGLCSAGMIVAAVVIFQAV